METSLFLGKVIGWILVISALAAFSQRKNIGRMLQDFSNNIGLTYFSGMMALIIGLLIVTSHNIWTSDWRVLITLVGWLSILKGVIRMFAPERALSWGISIVAKRGVYVTALLVFLVIGVVLIRVT